MRGMGFAFSLMPRKYDGGRKFLKLYGCSKYFWQTWWFVLIPNNISFVLVYQCIGHVEMFKQLKTSENAEFQLYLYANLQ